MSLISDERVEELLAKEAAQEAEIARLRAALEETNKGIAALSNETYRLRATLEEIANHLIDSELASREKRAMARKALANELKSTLADETAFATLPATAAKPGNDK